MSEWTRNDDLMRELMELPGPTGQERRVMDWLRRRWTGKAERVWTAKGGNVFAHVGGNGPRLLVEGHADEIGFIVRSVDSEGFIWLTSGQVPRSDIAKRYPIGQPALILGRDSLTAGVFASTTGHILSDRQRQKEQLDYYDLFVDIGVSSRDEVFARGIHPGAGVIWNPPARRIGNRVTGKAVDDRFALAIMTLLLEEIEPSQLTYDLYFAATTQEEIGLVGASSLRSEVDADLAIALDNGPVGDIPTVDRRALPTRLGGGPALVHKDGRAHYSEDVTWRIAGVAERSGIPIQHCVWEFFGSDGDSLIQQGIPTGLIGLSTRYTHSPFETYDVRDFDLALELMRAFITTPYQPS